MRTAVGARRIPPDSAWPGPTREDEPNHSTTMDETVKTTQADAPEPTEGALEFSIEGMTCAGCSAAVERVVSRLEGVGKVSVNLMLNRAWVEPAELEGSEARTGSETEARTDALAEKVAAAVHMAGYTAHYEKKKS